MPERPVKIPNILEKELRIPLCCALPAGRFWSKNILHKKMPDLEEVMC